MSVDLVNNGHKVTVLTGIPNHPYGSYYKGYKLKLWQKENINGVEILRVPIFPDHSMSVHKRILNYISFSLSVLIIGSYLIRNKKVDIIFAYLPPLTIGLPARILSLLKRAPIVYWMTDLWPENILATGKRVGRLPTYIISMVEKWVYSTGCKVTVNSEGFIPNLLLKGVLRNKLRVISDYADPKLFYPAKYDDELAMKYKLKNKFNVVYAGNLGKVQGVHNLIYAAGSLQNETNFQLVLIGDGTEMNKLKKIVLDKKFSNIIFISKKPMDQISQYFALSDVLVLHLIDSKVFRLQMPSKLIAYMAAAKPIFCAFQGTASNIVLQYRCGVSCESSDVSAITKQMKILCEMEKDDLRSMGDNARSVYLKRFTREIQNHKVEEILSEAISRKK